MSDVREKVARAMVAEEFKDSSELFRKSAMADWPLWEPLAQAAISAHLDALKEAGYVVVPVEPTTAMLEAGAQNTPFHRAALPLTATCAAYQAMLTAAQEPTAPKKL